MILLTGGTGTLGRPLLQRLLGAGMDVRCMVREPRRLGPARVQVQIAVGNLADRHGFTKALRGVDTVVHLAATTRDQQRGGIEELNGIATARMVAAARRAGVERFVYVSSIGASRYASSRFIRTQAIARDAIAAAGFESLIFEASIIYAPNDPWLGLLAKLARLPVMPVAGDGRARFQPIWADDAADAITAAMTGGAAAGVEDAAARTRYIELVGPEVLTHDEVLRTAMRSFGRSRPLLHLSRQTAQRLLRLQEWYLGPSAVATWDEAELLDYPSVATRGTADLEALGVRPLAIADVLPAR
ncbi:MAG: NAD(P)H-binding protein [Solirubrobacterales bacterium]